MRYTPQLRRAATRPLWLPAIIYFGDRAQTADVQLLFKVRNEFTAKPNGSFCSAARVQIRVNKRPNQPRPDRPLVISRIEVRQRSVETRAVRGIGGIKCSQPHWCEQLLPNNTDYGAGAFAIEEREGKR